MVPQQQPSGFRFLAVSGDFAAAAVAEVFLHLRAGAADRFTGLETQFYQFTQGVMEPWRTDSHQHGLQAWDSELADGPFSACGG